ncbi:MAG: hypothetical protein AB7S98_24640 [Burkholderiaceae bacterium]
MGSVAASFSTVPVDAVVVGIVDPAASNEPR